MLAFEAYGSSPAEVIRAWILRELWISNRARREILLKVRRGHTRRRG